MALLINEVKRMNIEQWINIILKDFHLKLVKELDIEDMNYVIEIVPFRNIEGYPDLATKACCVPDNETSIMTNKIKEVVFFTEAICTAINSIFSSINVSDVFYELAEAFVKFAFIHELVHVHQIKFGLTFEEYFETSYSDNQYEKEANEVALDLLDKIFGVNKSIVDTLSEKLKLN